MLMFYWLKMMPPSWRSVFALVGLLTFDSCVRSLFVAMHVVLYSERLLAVFI